MNNHPDPVASAPDPADVEAHAKNPTQAARPGPKRRRRRSPEQWRTLVAAQPGSGMDAAAFCEQHDVGIAGFKAWRTRLRPGKASADAATPTPAFLRVQTEPAPAAGVISAAFPGGVTLTITPDHLGPLVAALRETAPC